VLVFEADGAIRRHAGGYSDWSRRRRGLAAAEELGAGKREDVAKPAERRPAAPRKLSYKLQRELEGLPEIIAGLEAEIEELNAEICAPDFFARRPEATRPRLDALTAAEERLERAMNRWIELEDEANRVAAQRESTREP
jgi:ATP-binding cassette subfamily F protein uup